jgi:pantoate--beta-alanine ligase
MNVITSIKEMSALSKRIKARGQKIALVPTMGALHEGHLALVAAAKAKGDVVVVSIFVNPTQFAPGEDYSRYPRDLKKDKERLKPFDPLIVFSPKAENMYPAGFKTTVKVAELGERLCGKSRPGHFAGVTTVVNKIFNIVMPDFAFFGEKDWQQQVIIKKMIKDLDLGIEIIALPTVREYDGLAMSSRNLYLFPKERQSATALYRALGQGKKLFDGGERDSRKLIGALEKLLDSEPDLKLEYLVIVDPETLEEVKKIKGKALIAMAARIGATRLIDNIFLGKK